MKPDRPPALKRTGKREVAYALLGVWFLITARLFLLVEPEMVGIYAAVYATATTAIFGFVGWAFGLQAYQQVQAHKSPWTPPIAPPPPEPPSTSKPEHHYAG